MRDQEADLPLSDLEPTKRFSERAADYARYRPDYASAAIDFVLEGLPDPSTLAAADVGAGTGISARELAERGVTVSAVEPNPEMRAAAEPHPLVSWHGGTAEATGLAEQSVDLVLCAQAFHWFREREALAEFHRILRPHGRLAVMWNRRSREDPLTLGYIEAIHAVNGEHPAEKRPLHPEILEQGGLFRLLRVGDIPHAQVLDRAGLVGRAMSASYVPKEGPAFDELVRLLDELFDRHRDTEGRVRLLYRTQVWLAEKRS